MREHYLLSLEHNLLVSLGPMEWDICAVNAMHLEAPLLVELESLREHLPIVVAGLEALGVERVAVVAPGEEPPEFWAPERWLCGDGTRWTLTEGRIGFVGGFVGPARLGDIVVPAHEGRDAEVIPRQLMPPRVLDAVQRGQVATRSGQILVVQGANPMVTFLGQLGVLPPLPTPQKIDTSWDLSEESVHEMPAARAMAREITHVSVIDEERRMKAMLASAMAEAFLPEPPIRSGRKARPSGATAKDKARRKRGRQARKKAQKARRKRR